jgi:hypothetical protein
MEWINKKLVKNCFAKHTKLFRLLTYAFHTIIFDFCFLKFIYLRFLEWLFYPFEFNVSE